MLEPQEEAWVLNMERELHPMRLLQALVPVLALPDADELTRGVALANKLPTAIATHHRGEAIADRVRRLCRHLSGCLQQYMPVEEVDP